MTSTLRVFESQVTILTWASRVGKQHVAICWGMVKELRRSWRSAQGFKKWVKHVLLGHSASVNTSSAIFWEKHNSGNHFCASQSIQEYKMHEPQIRFLCIFCGANKNGLTESKEENFTASEPFVRDIPAKRFGILGIRCLADRVFVFLGLYPSNESVKWSIKPYGLASEPESRNLFFHRRRL